MTKPIASLLALGSARQVDVHVRRRGLSVKLDSNAWPTDLCCEITHQSRIDAPPKNNDQQHEQRYAPQRVCSSGSVAAGRSATPPTVFRVIDQAVLGSVNDLLVKFVRQRRRHMRKNDGLDGRDGSDADSEISDAGFATYQIVACTGAIGE